MLFTDSPVTDAVVDGQLLDQSSEVASISFVLCSMVAVVDLGFLEGWFLRAKRAQKFYKPCPLSNETTPILIVL